MTAADISLIALALVPPIYRAWRGWREGAATEVRFTVVILFALLVAIRYWQPTAEALSAGLTFDPRLVALGAFGILFVVGALVSGYAVRLRATTYRSTEPDPVNRLLGLIAGFVSGGLVGAAFLWLATIAAPGKLDALPMARAISDAPRAVYQTIERSLAGVPAEGDARTRFPVVTVTHVATGEITADGGEVRKSRGAVAWQ